MRADEPEFFSVGAEVPHRLSQLGLVLFRLVGVEGLLLLLLVVVVLQLLQVEVQQPLSHLLELQPDRKSTRLNSSHVKRSRMPSSA